MQIVNFSRFLTLAPLPLILALAGVATAQTADETPADEESLEPIVLDRQADPDDMPVCVRRGRPRDLDDGSDAQGPRIADDRLPFCPTGVLSTPQGATILPADRAGAPFPYQH